MLIKQKDDVGLALQTLEGFLTLRTLTGQQRGRIEEELDKVRAGTAGEKEAAYHIDFKLKDSKNWVVVHDLRLEHNGRVAQVDHLLINRWFDVFVIESKNLKTAVRVNKDDEFEVKTRWGWKGMASPVEQNKRHIQVLRELIDDEKLTPTRLGLSIRPRFHNWVLVAPECNLTKGDLKEATILKTDMFDRGLEQFINHSSLGEVMSLAKLCSTEKVAAFAQRLAGFHRPILFDFAAKFGITEAQRFSAPEPKYFEPPKNPDPPEKQSCESCRAPVENRVVAFCRSHDKRFGGKVLCRKCQATAVDAKPVPEPPASAPGATCHECGNAVDAKVLAFCRFNSRRFNKKIMCRPCQTAGVPAAN